MFGSGSLPFVESGEFPRNPEDLPKKGIDFRTKDEPCSNRREQGIGNPAVETGAGISEIQGVAACVEAPQDVPDSRPLPGSPMERQNFYQ